jgi:hypothetical protein
VPSQYNTTANIYTSRYIPSIAIFLSQVFKNA